MNKQLLTLAMLGTVLPFAALPVYAAEVSPAPAPASTPASTAAAQRNTIINTGLQEVSDNKILLFFLNTSSEAENPVRFLPGQEELIAVTPELKDKKVFFNDNMILIQGDYAPNTVYIFRVPKTIKTNDGFTLKRDAVIQCKTDPLSPQLAFQTEGFYFTPGAKNFVLPYRFRSTGEFRLTIHRFFENGFIGNHKEEIVKTMIQIPEGTTSNGYVYGNLDLSKYIKDRKPGIYEIEIVDPKRSTDQYPYYGRYDEHHLILSDLGASVSLDETARTLRASVRTLSTGKPADGATVKLITTKNQIAAEGVTDKNGEVAVMIRPDYRESMGNFAVVQVNKGDDTTLVSLIDYPSKLENPGNTGFIREPQPRAFVYAERNILRPGETIRPAVFVRQLKENSSSPLANAPVKMFLFDPTGKMIRQENVTTNEYGFAKCAFQIAESAPTGDYRIACGLDEKTIFGSFHFLTAFFVPDQIKVSILPLPETVMDTDAITFKGIAEYYFGAALTEGAFRFEISDMGKYQPDHFKGWTVGTQEGFTHAKKCAVKSEKIADIGNLAWPGRKAVNGKSTFPVKMLASLSVNTPGGRPVTANKVFCSYPMPYFLGVRDAKVNPSVKPGSYVLEVQQLSADPQKKDCTAVMPEVTLKKKTWEYVTRRTNHRLIRDWECVSRDVKADHVFSAAVGSTPQQLTLSGLTSGEYEITLTSGEMKTAYSFWYSEGSAGLRTGDPNRIVAKTDKAKYQPGETARLTLYVPAESSLLAVYGESTTEQMLRKEYQAAGEITLDIPIRSDLETEVWHVSLSCISGRNNDTQRAYGFFSIPVDQSARTLTPALTVNEKARPGETVTVAIDLKDKNGKATAGLVHVFAVDEGVLALTGFKTPDITKWFFGPAMWLAGQYDNYGLYFPDIRLLPDGTIGGDRAGSLALRRENIKQKDIALAFAEPVLIPADGKGKVTLKMPEHTGSLRIMAVASGTAKVGSADTKIVLRNPVSVTLSAPAAVNPGDVFQVACTVFNHELPDGTYTVNAKVPSQLAISTATKSGTLKKGASEHFTLSCVARSVFGAGDISVTVKMGNEQHTETLPVTVRIPTAYERRSALHTVEKGKSMTLKVNAADWYKGEHTVSLSASPAHGLPLALDFLNEYPYGCLEQTVSGVFPFLALDNLQATGMISGELADNAKDRITVAIQRILSMQRHDGSFSMWPGLNHTWHDASVYAAHFLLEAKARDLYPGNVTKLKNYLRANLKKWNGKNVPRLTQAYTGYVLAVAGDDSAITAMRNLIMEEKNDFASVIAALAMIRGGYAAEGVNFLNDLLKQGAWANAETICGSKGDAAGLGMLLTLLLENVPRSPYALPIANALAKQLRPDSSAWGSTQANAWASMGLAAFAADFPTAEVSKAQITQDGKVRTETFKDTVSFSIQPGKPVVINNQGDGLFQVRITSAGHPTKAVATDRDILLKREYLDENGFPVTRVKHGDIVYVRIYLKAPHTIDNLVLCDILPAGLEIEDPRLATRSAAGAGKKASGNSLYVKYLERGTDRFILSGAYEQLESGNPGFIQYRTRAVTRGSYTFSSCTVEDMYDPDMNGTFQQSGVFVIE